MNTVFHALGNNSLRVYPCFRGVERAPLVRRPSYRRILTELGQQNMIHGRDGGRKEEREGGREGGREEGREENFASCKQLKQIQLQPSMR